MASKWDIPSSSGQSHTDQFETESLSCSLKLLKPLDEILRCNICFEYFNDCMMTKCGHNYCSLCIRRYMMYKSQCPLCFQEASEPELKNNRLIDEILEIYRALRKTMEESKVSSNCMNLTDVKVEKAEKPEEMKTDSFNDNVQYDKEIHKREFETVLCPVCNSPVSPGKINSHLDDCLINKETIQISQINERKLLPKVVYYLLSDKEIKKHLKDHGLNTSGDRQALIRRHKNFLVLYNSNCDSLNPRPVSELVKQVEAQENEEKANKSSDKIHQFHKKSEPSVIEKEQESYLRKHCDQFSALIKDIQERQQTQDTDQMPSTHFKSSPESSREAEISKHKQIDTSKNS